MIKKIRVAAFWFHFGQTLGFDEQRSLELSKYFSKLNKPWNQSKIVISALRVFIRYHPSFKDLVAIIENSKNSQSYVTSKLILDAIKVDNALKRHFKDILFGDGVEQNISILLGVFFGFHKNTSSNPKYLVEKKKLSEPILIFDKLKGIRDKESEIIKAPITGGIQPLNNEIANFIDEKFE